MRMVGARLRVLHVCEPQHAGAARVAFNLAHGLRRFHVDPTVCTPPGALRDWCHDAGLQVLDLPFRRRAPASYTRALRAVRQAARSGAFDLVHAHSSFSGVLVRLLPTGRLPPIVFQPHAWSFLALTGGARAAAVALERALGLRTQLLLCVSEDELRVGRAAGIQPESSVVIPNGVPFPEPPQWRPSAGAPRELKIGAITRLTDQKGVDVMLHAMAQQTWPSDSTLEVVGDGPECAALASLARRLALADRITFAGRLDDTRSRLSGWDLFVLPSRYEAGIALALLEAIAEGVPIIATEVAGTTALLERGDPRLVAVGDPVALAAAVGRAARQWAETVRLAAATRERAKRAFSLEHQLEATLRAYETIADRGR